MSKIQMVIVSGGQRWEETDSGRYDRTMRMIGNDSVKEKVMAVLRCISEERVS